MKTILITGGTSGIGLGLAKHYLQQGEEVIIVGSSANKGKSFIDFAKLLGAETRAFFIKANLGSIKENKEVITKIRTQFKKLDLVILCAAKHSKVYTETEDGIENTFALACLSRYVLSYGLKELLESSINPMIINVCGTGMKGEVNWKDLQFKQTFDAQTVMMHGSRLNDLLGVSFTANDTVGKIKYVMYNPMAVKTDNMMNFFENPLTKLLFRMMAKPIDKVIISITEIAENQPKEIFSAYKKRKKINTIDNPSYNKNNAEKLSKLTTTLLDKL